MQSVYTQQETKRANRIESLVKRITIISVFVRSTSFYRLPSTISKISQPPCTCKQQFFSALPMGKNRKKASKNTTQPTEFVDLLGNEYIEIDRFRPGLATIIPDHYPSDIEIVDVPITNDHWQKLEQTIVDKTIQTRMAIKQQMNTYADEYMAYVVKEMYHEITLCASEATKQGKDKITYQPQAVNYLTYLFNNHKDFVTKQEYRDCIFKLVSHTTQSIHTLIYNVLVAKFPTFKIKILTTGLHMLSQTQSLQMLSELGLPDDCSPSVLNTMPTFSIDWNSRAHKDWATQKLNLSYNFK